MKRKSILFLYLLLLAIGLAYETQSLTEGWMSGSQYGIVGLSTLILLVYALPAVWALFHFAKKWNTRTDSEVKSSKKADKNDYPGYTDAQVEAARVWAYVIKNVPSELNISNSAAGTKIYNGGLGVDYPKDVRHLFGSYSAEGNITYASNGDGTVTIYPVPSHWQQSADELNSEEFMTQFTQGILDHAETVTLPDGDPDMIRQILAVLK